MPTCPQSCLGRSIDRLPATDVSPTSIPIDRFRHPIQMSRLSALQRHETAIGVEAEISQTIDSKAVREQARPYSYRSLQQVDKNFPSTQLILSTVSGGQRVVLSEWWNLRRGSCSKADRRSGGMF